MTTKINGPFGNYEPYSLGGILNLMCREENIPLTHVEHVHLRFPDPPQRIGEVVYQDKTVGYFRSFEGLKYPLFRWNGEWAVYNQHQMVLQEDNTLRPKFKLGLSTHESAGFSIHGPEASPELHRFIRGHMLTNWIDQPGYKLSKNAGAFFQGGSNDEKGQWIYIEFWNPRGAQAWMDYLNEHYCPGKTQFRDELWNN